jgi:hypothetical protein
LGSILLGSGNTSYAAVKAGAICSKAGATAVAAGEKYTCVKNGKKITWQKTISSKGSTNLVHPIRIAAYESARAYKCATTHSRFKFTKEIGPNFPVQTAEKVNKVLENNFKCFNDFFDSEVNLKIFYFTQSDSDFVRTQVATSINSGDVNHLNSLMKDMEGSKWGAKGMVGGFVNWSNDRSYLYLIIHSTDGYQWQEKDDHLVTHEFAHVMQDVSRANLRNEDEGSWYRQIPGYFMEGGAEALGYIFEAKSASLLNSQMQEIENYMSKDPTSIRFRNVSSESEMLIRMRETISPTEPGAYNIQYPLGGLISEYIMGKYGFTRYLQLIKNSGKYKEFSDNLIATVGVDQGRFLEDAAPYVYSQWKIALNL